MNLKILKNILLIIFIQQNVIVFAKKQHKRRLISMPKTPSVPGKTGGGAGGGSSDPDEFKSTDDKDLKASGNSIGIVMRVDRPEDAKPVYINMSPMYDFRNYII